MSTANAASYSEKIVPAGASSCIGDDEQVVEQEIHENKELKKYWAQRYRLFTKFDQGIKLDYGINIIFSLL